MSSALSLPNGRGMSSNERAVSPFTVTSKQPLRGFSSLTTTLAPGKPALTSASSLVALVLNAPQDLQASILTKASPLAAFLGGAAFFAAAGFFAIVFVGGIYHPRNLSVQSSRQFQACGGGSLTRAREIADARFIPQRSQALYFFTRILKCQQGTVMATTASPPALQELALAALRAALLRGEGPDSLAPLPGDLAQHLFKVLAVRLQQVGNGALLSPPIELARQFYGGALERFKQSGASDEWAGEAFGGGLIGLRSLKLLKPRLTAHGYAHIACSQPRLEELTIADCAQPLSEACVLLLCKGCSALKRLRLTNCHLALSPSGATTLLHELPGILELDLSENPLSASVAQAVCEHASASCPSLSALSLSGSFADDEACLACMTLPAPLHRLDLSWSRVSGEGAQLVAAGLGERLAECRLSNLPGLQAGDASRFLPALARIARLHLGGNELDADDCEAVARLPTSLTALNLRDARLVGVGRHAAFERLLTIPSLTELCVGGITGGGGDRGDGEGDLPREADPIDPPASLTHLDCADCSFEPQCAPALAACIRRSRHSLQHAELRRAPHTVGCWVLDPAMAADDEGGSFPSLALLDVTGSLTQASVAPLINLIAARCPALHTLHADGNAWLTDGHVAGLARGGLRRSLRVLTLNASSCSAHALVPFRALQSLEVLGLEGCSISATQAATLPILQRKVAAAKSAAELLEMMQRRHQARDRANGGGGRGSSEILVTRYSAESLRALRDSPYSQLPARPLPALSGVVLPDPRIPD